MSGTSMTARRVAARVGVVMMAVVVATTVLAVAPAGADTAPPDPSTPKTVSADSLPTVQINGVVWDQVVVGNTVYATGSFTSARPAGSPAGTNETPRSNVLAYDITTGNLITSWAPTLNAQGRSITASPDGTRIYVGGDFTTVNGATRNHLVALDATTGATVTSFASNVNSWINDMEVASDGNLYLVGAFTVVSNQARNRIASVDATTGAITSFAPSADQEVRALVTVPGKVVVGGSFTTLNGASNLGLGALDPTTGAVVPFPVNQIVQNWGPDAFITSLSTNGTQIFGTGVTYLVNGTTTSSGNLEADFASDLNGNLQWVNGCRGDHYDAVAIGSVLYDVSHAHDCSAIGGHPQANPWNYQRAMALTTYPDPGGRLNSSRFPGRPAPQILQWLPSLAQGSYTGQDQAAWTIEGNSQYVVMGGEFPRINGTDQQGLGRFAVSSIAPNKELPQGYTELTPKLVGTGPGTVRISWTTAWDRDNQRLTYEVLRGTSQATSTVLATFQQDSNWWTRPEMAFTDTTATPGSSQTYRLRVRDPFNNILLGAMATVTVPTGTPVPSAYANVVKADGANRFWRLGEPSGTAGWDVLTGNDLTLASSGVTRNVAGAISGDTDTATTFAGSSTVPAATSTWQVSPQTFTEEAWFKTTTSRGGKIIGFGSSNTANSSTFDRSVYMDNNGAVRFGASSAKVLASKTGLNDGQWHHVVASMGPSGIRLVVDGKVAGTDATVTSGSDYWGYWRVGGDALTGWPSKPTSNAFAGTIDDVAVYPAELSLAQAQNHWLTSGRAAAWQVRPTDPYGAAVWDSNANMFLRLDETSGDAVDRMSGDVAATYSNGITRNQAGSPANTAGRSINLSSGSARVVGTNSYSNPQTFSMETWFNTTTTSGGRILGFGNSQSATSSSYDRMLWMINNGRLRYGVNPGSQVTIDSPTSYNDGKWHHVVVTQQPGQQRMYVDGNLVASGTASGAQSYTGYWRIGSDNTWSGASSNNFRGLIDDTSIYPTVLSNQAVVAHWVAAGGQAPNQAPTASFTSSSNGTAASFNAAGSSDPDGTVASYAWNFGDGTTGTGVAPSHTYGALGTYTVTLTVTDNQGATGTVSNPIVITVPNQLPTASFTSSSNFMTASFDGTASSDPDGTVASYAWDFGDGTTGTGATPSHTYTVDGTYTATLTVTDNQGGTGSTSQPVTVTLPPNQLPTAAFSATASKLSVGFDGTASSDPDGTIASYAWDFGDGTTGTGATTSHDYAVAGTYSATLTVTDNRGGTATKSLAVTAVAPPTNYAIDTFTRTVASGLGSAELGGAWTVTGTASNYSVSGGAARISAAVGANRTISLDGIKKTDTEVGVRLSYDKAQTGGGSYAGVIGRRIDASNDYRLKLRAQVGGAVTAQLVRIVAGTETVIQNVTTVPGLTWNAGEYLKARLQVTGTSPTTLNAKVWKDGTSEPAAWLLQSTDSTAALQANGGVGIWDYLSGSSTNAPVTLAVDDLVAGPVGAVTPPPNQSPTASFTSSANNLTASFNAAASSDPDGTVVSYAWDFGDGQTGTGVAPSHTYAVAGTYNVTLTVTDDKGATGTATNPVTTTAPNVPPTASFTSSVTNLSATFDGSGSSDPDGTVASYAWDFGDGQTGTGVAPSHTYAVAGAYTVTLTVTDNQGATATTSLQVNPTAPPLYASDSFSRTSASGLGTADLGGNWTVSGSAANYTVAGGVGRISAGVGATRLATLDSVKQSSTEVDAKLSLDATQTGGGTYFAVIGRRVDASNDYRVKFRVQPTGVVTAQLIRVVGGVETAIQTVNSVPGLTYAPGDVLQVRFQVSGVGTTALAAKVWKDGTAEPATWTLQGTDTTAALQANGSVGLWLYLSGSSTVAPMTLSVDDVAAGPLH